MTKDLEKYNKEEIVIKDKDGNVIPDDPDYVKLKQLSKEVNIPPTEVEIEDPITHKKSIVKLDFNGTTDEKVAAIMLSPHTTEDQRNAIINAWLWERGRENSSLLGELFMYKGQHTRETRAFKSQTTETLEHLNSIHVSLYKDIAEVIYNTFKQKVVYIENFPQNVNDFLISLYNFYKKNKEKIIDENKLLEKNTIKNFFKENYPDLLYSDSDVYALDIAVRLYEGSVLLDKELDRLRKERMKQRGWGIYIDKDNKIHNIYDDDIEDIIKKEKEEFKEVLQKVEEDKNRAKN